MAAQRLAVRIPLLGRLCSFPASLHSLIPALGHLFFYRFSHSPDSWHITAPPVQRSSGPNAGPESLLTVGSVHGLRDRPPQSVLLHLPISEKQSCGNNFVGCVQDQHGVLGKGGPPPLKALRDLIFPLGQASLCSARDGRCPEGGWEQEPPLLV